MPVDAKQADSASTAEVASKEHILFVDDEENILRSLRRLFRKRDDWECHFANGPGEAIKMITQYPIAVVVSDHRMPQMEGATLLGHLKEKRPGTIRMMLTGQANLSDVEKVVNSGEIFRFILKPWQDDDLIEAVASAVAAYKERRTEEVIRTETQSKNSELAGLNQSLEAQVKDRTQALTDALHTARALNVTLKTSIERTILTMYSLLGCVRPKLLEHSRRVERLARNLAVALNLTDSEVHQISIAGTLHDVGKLIAPQYLSEKDPQSMRDEERLVYQLHPAEGADRIRDIPSFSQIADLIASHHERFDGSGFPNGLRKDDVPIGSYIIGVCDFYDSLTERPTSDRQYQMFTALQSIRESGDVLFPGWIVAPMVQIVEDLQKELSPDNAQKVGVRDLAPKMQLACNVYTASGALLASAGTELTAKAIHRIRAVSQVDRLAGDIFVTDRHTKASRSRSS